MNLVQRVQDILLKPKDTWAQIDAESATVGSIYKEYLIILAAIPALAMFIGTSFIGVGIFGFSYHVPVVPGIVAMIMRYVLSLVIAYVMALIVDALAPSFGGTKNTLNAFKVVAFASTAAYVAGVLNILPSLSMLGLLAGLYSAYLVYLGLPVLMKCPEDKAIGYTAVVIVIGIVTSVVMGLVAGAVTTFGAGVSGGFAHSSPYDNQATAKTEAIASVMAAIAKQAAATAPKTAAPPQTAQQTAPQPTSPAKEAAPEKAVAPYTQEELKALLPDSIGGLKRVSVNGTQVGTEGTMVNAEYGEGAQRLTITFNDIPGSQLAQAMTQLNMTHEEETATEINKLYHEGPRTITEIHKKNDSESSYNVVLANSLSVNIVGTMMDAATLKGMMAAIPLDKAERLPRRPAA